MKRDPEAIHRTCKTCGKEWNVSAGGVNSKNQFYECPHCASKRWEKEGSQKP